MRAAPNTQPNLHAAAPTVNRIHSHPHPQSTGRGESEHPPFFLSPQNFSIKSRQTRRTSPHNRLLTPAKQHREAFLQDHSPLPDIHRSSLHQEAQSAYVSAGDRYLRTAVRQFINHTKFVRYHRISHLVIDILLYNFRNHKI